ncbi:uncharacterized protein LOC114242094 [Bombyx mandarina]|uniref:Uncharacterized protein LOC114242094 n=1 Tax=Bombyx mandarina TaxID=7092 RepID=A0A6J2JH78_BOMMA|nr:uncharacterized protein LOC114242094 [Bombyx mandarina]
MYAVFCLILISNYAFVQGEFVFKKKCRDVDTSLCTVHNVMVEPCGEGPIFCALKKNKPYSISLDVTPHFSANKLQAVIKGDVQNQNTFSTTFTRSAEYNDLLDNTLSEGKRTHIQLQLAVDKRASGKFPLEVRVWDEDDTSHVCCSIFTVKIK